MNDDKRKKEHNKPNTDQEPTATRLSLKGISSRAFEHPADRAALTAMRKVPGFDLVLKKFFGLISERALYSLFLGSAVKVSEDQFPKLNQIYTECLSVLDVEKRPELFVAQTPFVNAGAIGVENPFIVLNSGTYSLLDEEELRFVLGHELGHILADHVLYKTMLKLLLRLSMVRFGIPFGRLAIFAIIVALSEWDRKSELSSDRAGLLCCQDEESAYSSLMRLAGGASKEMNIDAFITQAEEYESGGDELDSVFKIMNLFGRRHPFTVNRLSELRRWVNDGNFDTILNGEYPVRGDDEPVSMYDEISDSVNSYKKSYHETSDPLVNFLKDISNDIAETSGRFLKDLGNDLSDKGTRIFGGIKDRFSKKKKD